MKEIKKNATKNKGRKSTYNTAPLNIEKKKKEKDSDNSSSSNSSNSSKNNNNNNNNTERRVKRFNFSVTSLSIPVNR